MSAMQIVVLVFYVVIGIPNKIIDHKHRKREGYDRANPAVYYSRLSKEGNWEGKFMIGSGYMGFYCILTVCGIGFYELCQ